MSDHMRGAGANVSVPIEHPLIRAHGTYVFNARYATNTLVVGIGSNTVKLAFTKDKHYAILTPRRAIKLANLLLAAAERATT